MQIIHSGTLSFNKPLTREAAEIVNEILGEDVAQENDSCLDFDEWYENFFEDTIEQMIGALSPDGYVCDGTISYYGDYDGQIIVKDNVVRSLDIQDVGLYNATDETLIRMLEERGYTVTKKEDTK